MKDKCSWLYVGEREKESKWRDRKRKKAINSTRVRDQRGGSRKMSAITNKDRLRIDTIAHFIGSNMFANAQLDDARARPMLQSALVSSHVNQLYGFSPHWAECHSLPLAMRRKKTKWHCLYASRIDLIFMWIACVRVQLSIAIPFFLYRCEFYCFDWCMVSMELRSTGSIKLSVFAISDSTSQTTSRRKMITRHKIPLGQFIAKVEIPKTRYTCER